MIAAKGYGDRRSTPAETSEASGVPGAIEAPAPVDIEAMYAASTKYALQALQDQVEAAKGVVDYNIANVPRLSTAAYDVAVRDAEKLNDKLSARFFANLERLDPSWKQEVFGVAQQASDNTNRAAAQYIEDIFPSSIDSQLRSLKQTEILSAQYLSGYIPDDTLAMTRMSESERQQAAGLYGQAGAASLGKSIGLLSMQGIEQGTQMAQTAESMRANLMQQYSGSMNVASVPFQNAQEYAKLMMAYQPPMTDIQSLYVGLTNQITGRSSLQPEAVMQTGANLMNSNLATATNVSNQNQQMAWNAYAANKQQELAIWQMNQQVALANDTKPNPLMGALSGAIGGAAVGSAGGIWGAVGGAVVGGVLGYTSSR